jgi:hypothetical protein
VLHNPLMLLFTQGRSREGNKIMGWNNGVDVGATAFTLSVARSRLHRFSQASLHKAHLASKIFKTAFLHSNWMPLLQKFKKIIRQFCSLSINSLVFCGVKNGLISLLVCTSLWESLRKCRLLSRWWLQKITVINCTDNKGRGNQVNRRSRADLLLKSHLLLRISFALVILTVFSFLNFRQCTRADLPSVCTEVRGSGVVMATVYAYGKHHDVGVRLQSGVWRILLRTGMCQLLPSPWRPVWPLRLWREWGQSMHAGVERRLLRARYATVYDISHTNSWQNTHKVLNTKPSDTASHTSWPRNLSPAPRDLLPANWQISKPLDV